MAFTFIQTVTANTITGTGSYTTAAFGAALTVGNTVIVAVSSDGNLTNQVSAITDSKGNTYTRDFKSFNTRYVAIWRARITTGGTGATITITYDAASSNNSGIVAQEWNSSGAFTKDQTKAGTGTSATPTTGASSTTTNANEIVFGACVMTSTEASFTAGSGYTNGASALVSNASVGLQSKVVAATGAQTAGFTWPTSRIYTAILVTYYEAGTLYSPVYTQTVTSTDTLVKTGTRNLLETITNNASFASLTTYTRALIESVTNAANVLKTLGRTLLEAVTSSDFFSGNKVTVIDSYSQTNADNYAPFNGNASIGIYGQSFTGIGAVVDNAKFYLQVDSALSGSMNAKLYAHTGTYGTSSLPTGSALAVSDTVNASVVGTSPSLITFPFSGANRITLSAATKYVLTLETAVGNYPIALLRIGNDASSPSASGNEVENDGTWHASALIDLCFYLYGISSGNALSTTLSDSATLADALIKSTGRAFSEAITNVATLIKTGTRSLLETVTNTATFLGTILHTSIILESVTSSAVFSYFIGHFKTLSETITNSDAISRVISRAISDAITYVDTVAKTAGRTLLEAITNADTAISNKVTVKTISEALTYADSLARSLTRTLLETVTSTATLTKIATRNIVEAFTSADVFQGSKAAIKTLTEAMSYVDTQLRTVSRNLTEAVIVTAVLLKSGSRFFIETVTNSDALTKLRLAPGTFADAVSSTDLVIRSIGRSLIETLTYSAIFIKSPVRLLTETFTLVASVVGSKSNPLKSFLGNEALLLSDTVSRVILSARTFAERLSLSVLLQRRWNGINLMWATKAKSAVAVLVTTIKRITNWKNTDHA